MRRQKWKRFLAAILTAVMCLGEVGGTGMKVFAQDNIPSTEEAISEDDAASENDAVSEDTAEEETTEEEPADTPKEEQEEALEEEPDVSVTAYNLWVGGVQVTDANKADIPGVTGGKASYDPESKTLTLKGVKGFKGGYYPEGTLTPYVYSEIGVEDGFRITGDAEFTTPDIYTNGFYFKNGGSVNGDFTISGKASGIYGDTSVLTIEGGNIKLETEASVGLRSEYLTISGGTLDVTGKVDGIHCLKELWINAGDVKASGAETGIIATDLYVNGGTVAATATGKYDPDKAYENTVDGITVRNYTQLGGTVTARGDVYGLAAYDGDIKLENEAVLDARCPNTNLHIRHKDLYIGVYADKGSIYLNGGWLTCEGGNESYSIRTTVGDIVLGEGVSVLDPENGFVSEEYRDGYIKTGKAIFGSRNAALAASTDGVISVGHKDVTYYGLCLGHVEVTPLNQADIPVKSGKASYDPATKTLKCEDAVIETFTGVDRSEAILTYNDLIITGKLTIERNDDSGYGILAEDSSLQFVDADVTATGMKYGAIHVTDVKVGSIKVINSKLDVSAMSDESGDCAIWAGDRIILDRACIKASSGNAAMACGLWIDGEEKHTIVSPANAFFGDKQITDRNTMGPAKSVEIQPLLEDEVYVGDTKVNYSNKDNVLGDGKVSYDPDTKTLRFIDADITSFSPTYGACVYSDSDLRIEGSVKLSVKTQYGIRTKGSVTLNADIEGTKPEVLVYGGTDLYVEGGEIKATVTECGLEALGNLRIRGGNIDLTAGYSGLFSKNNVVISGGDIKLYALKDDSSCVKTFNGEFTMNGGRLYAKSRLKRALYARRFHITENDMRIALPEGGYETVYGENGGVYDPKTRNHATEVLIYKKGTQDCKVSFDMGGHGTQIAPQTVKDGTVISSPDNPKATGWIFAGWYSDDQYR
nr:carbohydrate-binding domain-containing protein [Lachnospiraceae bacterium]